MKFQSLLNDLHQLELQAADNETLVYLSPPLKAAKSINSCHNIIPNGGEMRGWQTISKNIPTKKGPKRGGEFIAIRKPRIIKLRWD